MVHLFVLARRFALVRRFELVRRFVLARRLAVVRRFVVVLRFAVVRFFRAARDFVGRFFRFAMSSSLIVSGSAFTRIKVRLHQGVSISLGKCCGTSYRLLSASPTAVRTAIRPVTFV